MNIRQIVKERMEKSGWATAHSLALLAKVPSRTVYNFLDRKTPTPINSDALGRILDVLKLEIVPLK